MRTLPDFSFEISSQQLGNGSNYSALLIVYFKKAFPDFCSVTQLESSPWLFTFNKKIDVLDGGVTWLTWPVYNCITNQKSRHRLQNKPKFLYRRLFFSLRKFNTCQRNDEIHVPISRSEFGQKRLQHKRLMKRGELFLLNGVGSTHCSENSVELSSIKRVSGLLLYCIINTVYDKQVLRPFVQTQCRESNESLLND